MSQAGMPQLGGGHAVSWYSLDADGVEAVAQFVADGWAQGDCAVLLATASHLILIDEALERLGSDPDAMRIAGRYVARDAEETLALFVEDGLLDPERFHEAADALLTEAGRDGSHVRAFGEMVVLLWQRGDVDSALLLEQQWNQLLLEHDLTLLCAYPVAALDTAALVHVRRICELHSEVAVIGSSHGQSSGDGHDIEAGAEGIRTANGGPVTVTRDHACSRVYLPVAESVPASRHFVVDVLRRWALEHVGVDAAIVVSELATNALVHAHSPFRVVLDRGARRVRIGVEDAAPAQRARLSSPSGDHDGVGGRGVAIVEALSRRWGTVELPEGKLVWAELGDTDSADDGSILTG